MSLSNTLIADAGATKIDWYLLAPMQSPGLRFQTSGMNAMMVGEDRILKEFKAVAEELGAGRAPKEIFYYGAGVATPSAREKISRVFLKVWPDAKVEVASDLLAAAHSLFGKEKGIACILGTGSNAGYYDGEKLESKIPSLGYILGDDGSGTALGIRLIREIFKGEMDEELKRYFINDCGLNLPYVLEGVYRKEGANKFIASFVPFIRNKIDHPFIKNMVMDEFRKFFRLNIAPYDNSKSLPVAFTGSIAFHFAPLLREAAEAEGFKVGKISDAPMEGLVEYHSKN